ncbi:MAG: aspartate ammonia-lyase [Tissierellia bacterium]|nr:aspartate ammonia-lyase [Tissierellia bacterium]
MDYRLEQDSIGEGKVPKEAYYGIHTKRGMDNFPITGQKLHVELVRALAIVKKACALANYEAGLLEEEVKDAIVKACDEIEDGKMMDEFITDPIQGGAGTTANMNANEVIANRANEIMGGKKGCYEYVHPNDHVNMGQSTNDVFPTSGKIAAVNIMERTVYELELLYDALMEKAVEFDHILKMGRTQLQDAVPIRLGQEFHAYASVVKRDIERMKRSKYKLRFINMGATAIGTGINVDPTYFKRIVPILKDLTGIDLVRSEDLIDGTNNVDNLVEVSGNLKTAAISLSKMASDFRLLSSGPKTMVADIKLPAKQAGSSIMPGKVNPVIPEVMNQVAYRVIGNDMTVTICGESGQLELNAFEPVLFYSLFESLEILANGVYTLRENCVKGIEANQKILDKDIRESVGIVTALVPHLGYTTTSKIAKESLEKDRPVRELIIEYNLMSEEMLDEILDPKAMTQPGIAAEYLIKQRNK